MNTVSEKLVQQEVSKCLLGMGIYPNVIGFTNLINSVIAVVEMGNNGPSICEAYKQADAKSIKAPLPWNAPYVLLYPSAQTATVWPGLTIISVILSCRIIP